MRLLARLLALILLALVPLAPAMSQERTFSHTGVAKDADRYETYLKANWKPGKLDPARLRAAAEACIGRGRWRPRRRPRSAPTSSA